MKKINHSISREMPKVKLYIDDIEKILEILKEENFSDIKIETTNSEYNESEVNSIEPTESLLNISSHNPLYISITFNSSYGEGVRIYTDTDTALAYGVINKIETLLKRKRRIIFSIARRPWFAFSFLVVGQAIVFALRAKEIITSVTFWLIILGIMIFYVILLFLDLGKIPRTNIISIKRKKDRISFWFRNKDQILVGIIVAIITAIISVTITINITNK
jgi:hypothetical protein